MRWSDKAPVLKQISSHTLWRSVKMMGLGDQDHLVRYLCLRNKFTYILEEGKDHGIG
jgi:hypothetical protein